MATNIIIDFINKNIFISALIIVVLFLIVKFLILPRLDTKGIKKEFDKTKKEMVKTLNESLNNATQMLPGQEKQRRKWNKRT
jgi:predicted Holliday junction resolvase-like endonuclease